MSKVNHRQAASQRLNFDNAEPVQRRDSGADVVPFRRQKAVPKRAKIVPYKFDQSAQTSPKVGESVAIRHRTDVDMIKDKLGSMLDMKGKVVRDGSEQRTISRVYMSETNGYSIQDHCGEQWLVRPASVGGCKWETFTPGEGRKELQ